MKDSSPAGPAKLLAHLSARGRLTEEPSEDFSVLAGSANFFYPSLHLGAAGGVLSHSGAANVDAIRANLAKVTLRAPIAGVVTQQDARVGEIVGANTVLVSLIAPEAFQIKTQVAEADIAKVLVGNVATFTLDAYEDDVIFDAGVFSIDPAETVIEGVATYKTMLNIKNPDERIRAGMTANVEILTAEKSDVISIPARAVTLDNGNDRKYVKILNEDGTVSERDVETGLRGSEGFVEIVSGVDEGDQIITFIRK